MPTLRLLLISLVCLSLSACQEDDATPTCTTAATVRDFSGTDGCGWMLELKDGSYLEPYLSFIDISDPLWCGMVSPDYQEGPYADASIWYDANPQDGMKVRIAYEILDDQVGVCMLGDVVRITCLEVLDRPEVDTPVR